MTYPASTPYLGACIYPGTSHGGIVGPFHGWFLYPGPVIPVGAPLHTGGVAFAGAIPVRWGKSRGFVGGFLPAVPGPP